MNQFKVGAPIRLFLLVISSLMWLGIWHTGFGVASWILYLPAVFLLFAAITGICPGLFFSKLITKDNG